MVPALNFANTRNPRPQGFSFQFEMIIKDQEIKGKRDKKLLLSFFFLPALTSSYQSESCVPECWWKTVFSIMWCDPPPSPPLSRLLPLTNEVKVEPRTIRGGLKMSAPSLNHPPSVVYSAFCLHLFLFFLFFFHICLHNPNFLSPAGRPRPRCLS